MVSKVCMLYGKFLVWRDSSFIMGGEMREGVVSVFFVAWASSEDPQQYNSRRASRASTWIHLGWLLFHRKCQNSSVWYNERYTFFHVKIRFEVLSKRIGISPFVWHFFWSNSWYPFIEFYFFISPRWPVDYPSLLC